MWRARAQAAAGHLYMPRHLQPFLALSVVVHGCVIDCCLFISRLAGVGRRHCGDHTCLCRLVPVCMRCTRHDLHLCFLLTEACHVMHACVVWGSGHGEALLLLTQSTSVAVRTDRFIVCPCDCGGRVPLSVCIIPPYNTACAAGQVAEPYAFAVILYYISYSHMGAAGWLHCTLVVVAVNTVQRTPDCCHVCMHMLLGLFLSLSNKSHHLKGVAAAHGEPRCTLAACSALWCV